MQLHRFRPRLLDALQRYDRGQFVRDVGAGITRRHRRAAAGDGLRDRLRA